MFGSLENERKRREEREERKANPKMKAVGILYNEKLLQKLLRVTKSWGLIVHPKCENTRMSKILVDKGDKVVIHQNVVV